MQFSCLLGCRARVDCSHRRQSFHVLHHSKPLVMSSSTQQHGAP